VGAVTVKGNGMELKGEGMALDLAEGKMILEKGVRTRLYPSLLKAKTSARNG
jgi:hypothetical protein